MSRHGDIARNLAADEKRKRDAGVDSDPNAKRIKTEAKDGRVGMVYVPPPFTYASSSTSAVSEVDWSDDEQDTAKTHAQVLQTEIDRLLEQTAAMLKKVQRLVKAKKTLESTTDPKIFDKSGKKPSKAPKTQQQQKQAIVTRMLKDKLGERERPTPDTERKDEDQGEGEHAHEIEPKQPDSEQDGFRSFK